MKRDLCRRALRCLVLGVVFHSGTADAGDPQAHSAAMIQAAKQVAEQSKYAKGVGAPTAGSVAKEGKFKIPIDGSDDCVLVNPGPPFPDGCSYDSENGKAINEPDDWKCTDPRQPEAINDSNLQFAPAQARIGNLLAAMVSEASMVCNWNHFKSNPALPASANSDANAAYETVRSWANEILTSIEESGAKAKASCDEATWKTYYYRTANSLHYVQDSVCEHHDVGNEVCYDSGPVPYFSLTPIVDLSRARACVDWVRDTVNDMVGVEPKYWCDEAVVEPGTRQQVKLNDNMFKVAVMCGINFVFDASGKVIVADAADVPMMSLACMGLERTFRHHCLLDVPKSLSCQGPPNDHFEATDNQQYCEGERYSSFGGEDFMGKAVSASVPVLDAAMARWATVCKEPDDPCQPQQCDNWCKRTISIESAGYCVNGPPDNACQLHNCICASEDECGARGKPCCTKGPACRDSDDECGGKTGTCVEKDTEICDDVSEPGMCQFLAEFCPSCDLESYRGRCEAGARSSNETTCQQTLNSLQDYCYPTSAYCESLRAACDSCEDYNDRLNCIAASSSRYSYQDPAGCLDYDIASTTCAQPSD